MTGNLDKKKPAVIKGTASTKPRTITNSSIENSKSQEVIEILKQYGFKFFPCTKDKSPSIPKGESWQDPKYQKTWKKCGPMVGAIIPLGSVVIDLDQHVGDPDGVKIYNALLKRYNLPDLRENNLTVSTGTNNGQHIYCTAEDLEGWPGKLKDLGIDFKKPGGYVIAPVSKGYTALNDFEPMPLSEEWIRALETEWIKKGSPSIKEAITAKNKPATAPAAPAALGEFQKKLKNIQPQNFPDNQSWIEFIMGAIAYAGNTSEVKEILETWSDQDPAYKNDSKRKNRIASITPEGGITAGTFHHLYKLYADKTIGSKVPLSVENEPGVFGSNTFPIIHIDSLKMSKPDYLIGDFMEKNILFQLFGETGSGKSFLILDVAFCIAAGIPWQGHEVKKAEPVLYILGEGLAGVTRRLQALKIKHHRQEQKLPFYISQVPAQLTDIDFMLQVQAAIEALPEIPVLIIIDTLSMNFGGGNESSTQDMQTAVLTSNNLRISTAATIALIHHPGYSNSGRSRGSSVLNSAMDRTYKLVMQSGIMEISCTKSKETDIPKAMNFKLAQVEFEDGFNSAVLNPVDFIPEEKTDISHITGKLNVRAYDIFINLKEDQERVRTLDGSKDPSVNILYIDWKEACLKVMNNKRFPEVQRYLFNKNILEMENRYIREPIEFEIF